MRKRILIVSSIFVLFVLTMGYLCFYDSSVKFDNPTLDEVVERFGINADGLDEALEKFIEDYSNQHKDRLGYATLTIRIKENEKSIKNKFFIEPNVFSIVDFGNKKSSENASDKYEYTREFVNYKGFANMTMSKTLSYKNFAIIEDDGRFKYFFKMNINIIPIEKHLNNKDFLISNIDISNKFPYKTGFYPAKYFEINDEENPWESGKYLIIVYAKFD